MRSAVTITLVPESRGGPFVFWNDLAAGCAKATALGFDAVEVFPRSPQELDVNQLQRLLAQHHLKLAAMGTGAGWVAHKLRLTDPDADVRRRAREFVAAIIDLAGGLGAPAIIGSKCPLNFGSDSGTPAWTRVQRISSSELGIP